jgi:DNA invertase Pin-like site-specific DNA recombinase
MEEKLDFDPPKKKARARKHGTKSGKPVGRPKVNDRKRRAILAARSRGLGINKIASELGVSRSTVRRVIAES